MSNRLYGPSGAPAVPGGIVAANTQAVGAAFLPALQIISTSATDTIILNPALNSATQALVVNIPPGGPLEQRRFKVLASGYVSTGASSTCTVKLWSGTSTTTSSDTVLASTGAMTAVSGKYPFSLEADLIYDSVSGKLDGVQNALANGGTIISNAALAGSPPLSLSINNANNPVLSFVLSAAFGTSNGANKINVQEFGIYER